VLERNRQLNADSGAHRKDQRNRTTGGRHGSFGPEAKLRCPCTSLNDWLQAEAEVLRAQNRRSRQQRIEPGELCLGAHCQGLLASRRSLGRSIAVPALVILLPSSSASSLRFRPLQGFPLTGGEPHGKSLRIHALYTAVDPSIPHGHLQGVLVGDGLPTRSFLVKD